ncbi:MAG: hypothetical protein LBQ31_06315 [Bacteroidales bacterium]|nr:hypothetical protein [Bacteroidales bacterium]
MLINGAFPRPRRLVRGRAFTPIFLPRKLGKKDFRSIPNAAERKTTISTQHKQ